ncbi:hypothetical protein R3P38DRAFT_2776508 [Favolaschia claudopus]|uniref:Uncharacterized protein n=1 Tax=Favolaschia claudopus TaxID=2862362 RepID=A0AAW0BMI2_9AGAR
MTFGHTGMCLGRRWWRGTSATTKRMTRMAFDRRAWEIPVETRDPRSPGWGNWGEKPEIAGTAKSADPSVNTDGSADFAVPAISGFSPQFPHPGDLGSLVSTGISHARRSNAIRVILFVVALVPLHHLLPRHIPKPKQSLNQNPACSIPLYFLNVTQGGEDRLAKINKAPATATEVCSQEQTKERRYSDNALTADVSGRSQKSEVVVRIRETDDALATGEQNRRVPVGSENRSEVPQSVSQAYLSLYLGEGMLNLTFWYERILPISPTMLEGARKCPGSFLYYKDSNKHFPQFSESLEKGRNKELETNKEKSRRQKQRVMLSTNAEPTLDGEVMGKHEEKAGQGAERVGRQTRKARNGKPREEGEVTRGVECRGAERAGSRMGNNEDKGGRAAVAARGGETGSQDRGSRTRGESTKTEESKGEAMGRRREGVRNVASKAPSVRVAGSGTTMTEDSMKY